MVAANRLPSKAKKSIIRFANTINFNLPNTVVFRITNPYFCTPKFINNK